MSLPPDPCARAPGSDGARPPPIPAAPSNAAASSAATASAINTGQTSDNRPRAMGIDNRGEQNSGSPKGPEERSDADHSEAARLPGPGRPASSPGESEGATVTTADSEKGQDASGVAETAEARKTRPRPSWIKFWDEEQSAGYYRHSTTNESRWASAEDQNWMEAADSISGHVYLEHPVTGESRWKATAHNKPVWEEMTDAGSGLCYYFSSVSNSSQWYPPVWMDYLDLQADSVYYFNTETHESRWIKPPDFVSTASEDYKPEPASNQSTAPGSSSNIPAKAASSGPKRPASSPPPRATMPAAAGSGAKRPRPPIPSKPPGAASPPLTSPSNASPQATPLPRPPPPPPAGKIEVEPPSPAGLASTAGGGGVEGGQRLGVPPPVISAVGFPPPPPNKPRGGSPVGSRWSPRGSVSPPPGPPPVANMPRKVEDTVDRMAVDTSEGEHSSGSAGAAHVQDDDGGDDKDDDDEDDCDIDLLEAGGAATG